MDKTIEGVDDLFLISIIWVVYFFLFFTVALGRVLPFMINLVTLLGDGLYKIFEQPSASIFVILCYLWMLEYDIGDEVQQMGRCKQCCAWVVFKCDLKDVDKFIDAVPYGLRVDLVDLVKHFDGGLKVGDRFSVVLFDGEDECCELLEG